MNKSNKRRYFVCRNCGFKFITPNIRWVPKPYPPHALVCDAQPYIAVYVCPRCGSDFIEVVVE